MHYEYDYDFAMMKRAYAEIARRAREKDEVRRGLTKPPVSRPEPTSEAESQGASSND